MINNIITQIREKITNATQDQNEFLTLKVNTNRKLKVKKETQ